MKRKILLTAVLLLVSLITLSTAGYAWFTMTATAEVTGMEVTVETVSSLEIRLDTSSEWAQSVAFAATTPDQTDVSSDGLTFYKQLQDADGTATSYEKIDTNNGHWVEQTIYFRTSAPTNVYVGNGTAVTPKVTDVTANPTSKSAYGPFSKDYIAGATRVAFLDSAKANPKTWVPNETYQLSGSGSSWTFDPSGTAETSHTYINGTDLSSTATFTPTMTTAQINGVNGSTFNSQTLIGETKAPTTADGFCYLTVVVRIWVEGTDREAKNPLAGGTFNVNLQFWGEERP